LGGKPIIAVTGDAPSMPLYLLVSPKSVLLPRFKPAGLAANAGIPPVLCLFYQAGVRRADRRQLALAPAVTILP